MGMAMPTATGTWAGCGTGCGGGGIDTTVTGGATIVGGAAVKQKLENKMGFLTVQYNYTITTYL